MKPRLLSAALIGTGQIAGGYDQAKTKGDRGIYSHAGAFRKNGKIVVQAVFDRDYRKAKAFSRVWKTQAARSMRDLLRHRYDLICLCTPDKTHFAIAKILVARKACRTLCIEKPAATDARRLLHLMRLADQNRIQVVINFQRHFEPEHQRLAEQFHRAPSRVLAVQGLYIKGLDHIGVTMIDTLRFLFGEPTHALALRRTLNSQANEYSYDFVLYFPAFAATIRTTDSDRFGYTYHVFEIDVLMINKRISIVDNSWNLKEMSLKRWGRSGVKGFQEKNASIRPTGFSTSMKCMADYLYSITTGRTPHRENTLASSLANLRVIEAIKHSYRHGLAKVRIRTPS